MIKIILLLLSILPTLCYAISEQTITVPVVRDHAGGDEGHSDTFIYTAPANYSIKSFEALELSRFGDATYTPKLISNNKLEIKWSTKSRTKKVAGVVVDTDTAELKLDVKITLAKIDPPQKQVESKPTKPPNNINSDTQENDSEINQVIVGIIVTVAGGLILLIVAPFIRRKIHPEPTKEEEKIVNSNWFDSSDLKKQLQEKGYTFYWSNHDSVEENKGKGYEVIFDKDESKNVNYKLVNKSGQILLGKINT